MKLIDDVASRASALMDGASDLAATIADGSADLSADLVQNAGGVAQVAAAGAAETVRRLGLRRTLRVAVAVAIVGAALKWWKARRVSAAKRSKERPSSTTEPVGLATVGTSTAAAS